MTLLTFIIPVRHQDNARDWAVLKTRIAQTVASISGQTHPDWRAVIVANEGADLPALPPNFVVESVSFPPNPLHAHPGHKRREAFWDAFRLDKGRRVLSGMLAARDSRFFMIVDDDDFVSARIVDHVARHREANGWHVQRGYLWDEGGGFVLATRELGRLCGTTLIIRSDLYDLPPSVEAASEQWIKTMLGSHRFIADILAERRSPLADLPFPGAVYRVASAGSHSGTPSFMTRYDLNRQGLRAPVTFCRTLARVRKIGDGLHREFGLPRLGWRDAIARLKTIA